jgi:hypothetical protein
MVSIVASAGNSTQYHSMQFRVLALKVNFPFGLSDLSIVVSAKIDGNAAFRRRVG